MKQENSKDFFQVEYIKFIPGGNDTALVLDKNYSTEQKKAINDIILESDKSIEQVGFVAINKTPELQMAGGEFCGNATRSAAYFYQKGNSGTTNIIVNCNDNINAGVYENGDAWCEIPLYHGEDAIIEIEKGIYQVRMNGMVSVVIQPSVAKEYLQNKDKLKFIALDFIHKYDLRNNEAVGVMFLEKEDKLQLHPVVWVREINTLYYETGCGSGTTAVAMVEAFLTKENQKLEVVQPSGLSIIAEITLENEKIVKAVISGKVKTDNKIVIVNVAKAEEQTINMKNNIREIKKENYCDFYKLYKVFEEPPYLEKYSDEEILEEYKFLTTGGHVFGYYIDGTCVGIVTYSNKLFYKHPIHYEHPEKVMYLSDVTVLKEYRNHGIGTELMKFALIDSKKRGYQIAYMRTLQPGQSMSYGIAVKLGFSLLEETEIVIKERQNKNRDIADKRIFLDICLESFKQTV